MTRALVIGYGSIGARHSRLLAEMGVAVACVTRNDACPFPRHADIADALARWHPDKVIVSNETATHRRTLADLARLGFKGEALVEKPLFAEAADAGDLGGMTVYVAFNLRFHPLVRRARRHVQDRPLFNGLLQAGSYLPSWRPGTDYTKGYSARREAGGGVLRDLAHELDLALWLCGPWRRAVALGGHFSDLAINSDDTYYLLVEGHRCPAYAVAVNYLDRVPARTISINGQDISVHLDLVAGRLTVNGAAETQTVERDDTYRAQLDAFLSGDTSTLCSFEEGREVDRLIVAAETAMAHREWVSRDQP